MLTRCTHCNTWFRIGEDDLLASEGEVRCGACNQQFNAFENLCETQTGDAEARAAYAQSTPTAEQPSPAPSTTSDPDADQSRETVLREIVESRLFSDLTAKRPMGKGKRKAKGKNKTKGEASAKQTRRQDKPKQPPRTAKNLIWFTASAGLALVLAFQIVFYAHGSGSSNNSVSALYNIVGTTSTQPRVNQWLISHAAVTGVPGKKDALVVTATLTNQASSAQAAPLLELTLKDRFGSPIARRAFAAKDYLVAKRANAAPVGAEQTLKVRLRVADTHHKAQGFRLRPCIKNAHGLVCAKQPQSPH